MPTPEFGIAPAPVSQTALGTPAHAESVRKSRLARRPTANQIRRRAREICHQRGESGEPYLIDWLHAERELNPATSSVSGEVADKE